MVRNMIDGAGLQEVVYTTLNLERWGTYDNCTGVLTAMLLINDTEDIQFQ